MSGAPASSSWPWSPHRPRRLARSPSMLNQLAATLHISHSGAPTWLNNAHQSYLGDLSRAATMKEPWLSNYRRVLTVLNAVKVPVLFFFYPFSSASVLLFSFFLFFHKEFGGTVECLKVTPQGSSSLKSVMYLSCDCSELFFSFVSF